MQLGFLTYGSSRSCAFPAFAQWASQHPMQLSMASGFTAGLLSAYSGGTVMDLHHLPRHYRQILLEPLLRVKMNKI